MESVAETLRAGCRPIWADLHQHPFVQEMIAGTLPVRRFGFYVGQNILYLQAFTRVFALAVAKAPDERTMRQFAATIMEILDLELPENRALLAKAKELDPSVPDATVMAPANLAYTRHLLTVAYEGGVPEILAAIMPCAWSYGDIGKENLQHAPDHPIYGEWIRFFAGTPYWDTLRALQAQLDHACADLSDAHFQRLAEIFAASSRLERAFWDMAYTEAQWPA